MVATQARYRGARIGITREVTPQEREKLQKLVVEVVDRPPWTEERNRHNEEFRRFLVELYEDGCSAASIATAIGWSHSRTAMQIRKGRMSGLGAGSRRYIEPSGTQREPAKRRLTGDEEKAIVKMFAKLPRTRGNVAKWNSREGHALIAYAGELRDDNVPLSEMSELMGMTRQGLSLHLKRFTPASPEQGKVAQLTAAQAKELTKMYEALPDAVNGSKVWASQQGLDLIRTIEKFAEAGVPLGAPPGVAAGSVSPRDSISAALGVPASVVGRMVGMREKFEERLRG